MLVEHERNDLQKRARWHVEVTFPLYMHAQFEGFAFIQCILSSGSMETCSSAMSTRFKQRAVIEFLTAKKMTPTEIHRRLKAVW